MKKSIAWLLAAVMVLSVLSLLPLTASAAGGYVLDFGTNGEALVSGTGYMTLQGDGFTRWTLLDVDTAAQLSLASSESTAYTWVKMAYRTEMENATLSVGTSGVTHEELSIVGDGLWNEAYFQWESDGICPCDLVLEIDRTGGAALDYVDIAYIAFFATQSEAEAYQYSGFNANKYAVKEDAIPVYNVTAEDIGSYYNTSYAPYGQRFVTGEDFVGIFVPQNSFYKATNNNNAGTVKVWAWNTDYATTTAADPLRTVELSKLEDKADLKAVFAEALPAGEYFFEVAMTAPSKGAYVAKTSTGAHKMGVESYCGGEKTDKVLCAGYLVEGYALEYLGNEYTTEPGIEFDFSLYSGSATEDYALTDVKDVTVTEVCDKGYLSLVGTGAGSSVTFPVHYAYTNETDAIVMWYRLAEGGETSAVLTATTATGTYTATLTLVADGLWHTATVSGAEWAAAVEKEITALTLSGIGTLDIAYLGFFANEEAANDRADECNGVPEAPLSPEQAVPQLLIDGEKLNMKEGNQCHGAEYSYDNGSLTLKSKGNHPYYSVISEPTRVAPILAIRYRVPVSKQLVQAKYYIGSEKSAATGGTGDDYGTFDYISDGRWHTAYIDLTDLLAYDDETNVINYFRFDFLNGVMVANESTLEIQYYAFFNSLEEAQSFQHDVPCLYTVMFDNGKVKAYAQFRKDDTKEYVLSLAPTIYPVDGFTVEWEDFEVGAFDLELHLVYTPVNDINDPSEEFDKLTGSDPVKPGQTPGGEDETSDVEDTTDDGETNTGDGAGCKAIVASAAILSALVLGAGVVVCRKKD